MSTGVVSAVLNHLSALIVAEANLLGGLQQEIQSVVDELEHMKAFLMFAEGRAEEDPRLQVWISQLQDLAYDIEDVVGEFLQHFSYNYGNGLYRHAQKFFISLKHMRRRHQIAQKVQSIKFKISSISASHRRYQSECGISGQASVSSTAVNSSWNAYKDAALLVDEAKVVGIDHPKQHLISQLLDRNSQFKVISIVGMGGIGKTTLVKKVYEDVAIKKEFHILAWVTVSQNWDIKKLLNDLIGHLNNEIQKHVTDKVTSITSTHELKAHVKEILQGKRYLIVFDDVWDPRFWDDVKFALCEGDCGNRVILTTRNADVGRSSLGEFQSYVHKMEPLSFEDSCTLLCKRTFKGDSCPIHLKNVVERILKKCGGLPLAVVAIGGVLALKDPSKISEWEIVEHSIGGGLELNGQLDPVRKILSLSYNELSYHLRTCLLYTGIFPEDYKIVEQRLIRLWISEGLVLENTRMTKYEIGRSYLDELSSRSLIQVTPSSDRSFRTYHIHDLIREVILSESKRQNFATIVTGEQSTWPNKIRRLAIYDLKSSAKSRICFKYLRSLVILKSEEPLQKYLPGLLFGDSRLLKVLDLEGTQLEKIPKEVFRLFQLKTLNLKRTRVKIIPKLIGSLKNLEYLDLSHTNVTELPEEILKIKGLVHLTIFRSYTGAYSDFCSGFQGLKSIVKLLSLEWLCDIKANEVLTKEIAELKQLKRLGICSLRREYGKQLCSSLGKLFYLEHLYLYAVNSDEVLDLEDMKMSTCSSLQTLQVLYLRGRLQKVPQLMSSLHELIKLDLRWCGLMENLLESLQYLPNLQKLLLINEAFKGDSLCFKAGCFLKLETLWLQRLDSLRWLKVEEGAMPDLKSFGLISLTILEEFPWAVQYLSKLQALYLEGMSDKLIVQLQDLDEESVDFKKIRHIHKILIWDDEEGWCRHPQYWKRRSKINEET